MMEEYKTVKEMEEKNPLHDGDYDLLISLIDRKIASNSFITITETRCEPFHIYWGKSHILIKYHYRIIIICL